MDDEYQNKENISNEIMASMKLKDEIINELYSKLEQEQQENNELKKRIENFTFRQDLSDDENQENKNKIPKQVSNDILIDKQKLLEENNFLKEKISNLENYCINAQNSNEIDNNYSRKTDLIKHKLEVAEQKINDLLISLEKKDVYINELLKQTKQTDKDRENVALMKDLEINNLNQKLNFANESINRLNLQINSISSNTTSITQDLRKELKFLEGKNKELEIKIFQQEKVILEKEIELKKSKENLQVENNSPSPIDLVIKSKLDNQNKMISHLNNELVNIKYMNDKLQNELNEERDANQKLQLSIAELKFKFNNSKNNNFVEDLAVQTIMRGENIDQLNNKLSTKENEIMKLSEINQNYQKDNQKLKDKNYSLEKENKKLCDELNTILKKINLDKKRNFSENYDKEVIYNISNVSKLNKTITYLKMKEIEYIDRIQLLESSSYEKEISKADNNLKKQNSNISEKKVPRSALHSNDENTLVSFNVSEQSVIERGINCNSKIPYSKDIHGRDIEIHKLLEDNILLKDSIFKYISEINNLQNIINNFRENYIHIENEKNEITIEKNVYLNQISELKNELQNKDNFNSNTYEEFNKKLNDLNEYNSKLTEQLISLQNKFQVQNQLNQEKNLKLQELNKDFEKVNSEKEKLQQNVNILQDKLNLFERENNSIKKELNTFRMEKDKLSLFIEESTARTNSKVKEQEELMEILGAENEKLKELNHKYKVKLKELYEEIKIKDQTLEEKEIEKEIKKQLQETRIDNENLMKERSNLRIQLNEVLLDNKILKEKLMMINQSNNNSKMNTSLDNSLNNSVMKSKVKNNTNYEKEIGILREENLKLSKNIEELKTKLNENENVRRNLLLEVQAFEIEKKRFQDIIIRNENEIRSQKNEINILKSNSENLNNIQNLLNEVNEKNQTINFLIEECDNLKKEHQKKMLIIQENSDCIDDENKKLKELLDINKKDFEMYKASCSNDINDLKKENEILINDLENKDKDNENLLLEKGELEKCILNNNKEFNEVARSLKENLDKITEENHKMKTEIKAILENHVNENKILNDKMKKNEKKVDRIFEVYENHIIFIKSRFVEEFNEIIKSYNNSKPISKDITDKLFKNIENYTGLINDIASKDAKIEAFKNEIKLLNKTLKSNQNNIKMLSKEIEDLKEMNKSNNKQKQKSNSSNQIHKQNNFILDIEFLEKFKIYEESYQNSISLHLDEEKYLLKIKKLENEIALLKEQSEKYKSEKDKFEEKFLIKEDEIRNLQFQMAEMNKNYKYDIQKYTNEISRIKEKWLPPEKSEELLNQISNYEKTIKTIKEDNNRKKELINYLKSTENKETKEKKNELLNDNSVNNDKLKNINKELARKDNYIKELKGIIENMKLNEKKISEELNSLTEKNKILKIEVNRKDELLKSTKEKISTETNSENKDKFQEQILKLKEKNKRIKTEIEKKDTLVKTYKNKIDSLNLEIEQNKLQISSLSKNLSLDNESQNKINEKWKNKCEQITSYNDTLLLILKRIFKDLVSHCENITQANNTRKNELSKYKEGFDILNISPNEIEEFVNPENQIITYDYYSKLIDNMNCIEPTLVFEKYLSLKEKITNFYQNK